MQWRIKIDIVRYQHIIHTLEKEQQFVEDLLPFLSL